MNRDNRTTRWALALALGLTLAGAGGCGGDDDGGEPAGDGGADRDGSTRDGAVGDGGGGDAGIDSGPPDAGDPAVPGTDPPTLSKVGLFNDELGPRILVEGRDPNGDVAKLKISYFKGSTPATVGARPEDNEPGTTGDEPTISSAEGQANFLYVAVPSLEFFDEVDTIKVIAYDKDDRASAELTAKLGTNCDKGTADVNCAKKVSLNGACNIWGFDRCSGATYDAVAGTWTVANVCTLTSGAYKCAALKDARRGQCTDAQALDPSANKLSVTGRISAPSRWEPPTGCVASTSKEPDAIVKLHLDSPATVLLSTDSPVTNFDAVLYKVGGLAPGAAAVCETQPAECEDASCTCADVTESTGTKKLRLPNLAAGDHYIAVDRLPSVSMGQPVVGVDFELKVAIE